MQGTPVVPPPIHDSPTLLKSGPGDAADTPMVGTPDSSQLTSYSERVRQSLYIKSKDFLSAKVDQEFNETFVRAQEAILSGVQPELIIEGSSGSYFVKDTLNRMIGIFKPKDEEPFAPLNPKWPKFFQRIMCFCCFGRACLIPNSGYLSETGASLIDHRLNLNVVPKTRVVKLASPSFFYERVFCGCWSRPVDHSKLRPKEGSFQLFVHGFEPADRVMARWEYDKSLLSPSEHDRFVLLFQKMVVLDYIIRNTDRHADNWLIRHVPGKELELAAIDNGLAFPVKHPEVASRLRQFPFKWQYLKYAKEPWNESLRNTLLETVTPLFVHNVCKEVKRLFRHEISTNRLFVFNQLRVLRGQFWNLRKALEEGVAPADMAKMPPILVKKRYRRGRIPPENTPPGNFAPFFKAKPAFSENSSCCCSCRHHDSVHPQVDASPGAITEQPGKGEAETVPSPGKGIVPGPSQVQ